MTGLMRDLSLGPHDCCNATYIIVKDLLMLFPWYAATMLAFESNGVIALRLLKMADIYDRRAVEGSAKDVGAS